MSIDCHIATADKYASNNYTSIQKSFITGRGIYVFDENNMKYMDCISGYSALNQGHCHPNIVKAASNQINKLTLTSRAYHNDKMGEYCKKLCETFNYEKVLLMNGGVESGEAAIKIARKWGYENKKVPQNEAQSVFFNNNFWGRSLAACSSSNDPQCYDNFGPYIPNFHLLDYNNINQLHDFLDENPNTVSVMLEPIQGEGGIILPKNHFLQDVRELCNLYNVLMIADEVQTGLGRTGKMLACDHYNIRPDILCLGKALSGGFYPISAVLANTEIMSVLKPGTHGSTFGGNPLACSIGTAALKVIEDEELCENSEKMGKYFREKIELHALSQNVKEVRGIGLLNAIEFNTAQQANNFVQKMLEKRVLTKSTRNTSVRITPPLTITKPQMTTLINKILKVLRTV